MMTSHLVRPSALMPGWPRATLALACAAALVLGPGVARGGSKFQSDAGAYSLVVPVGWHGASHSNEQIGEVVELTPEKNPNVLVSILSKVSDRPLTTREINERFKITLEGYKKIFANVMVERGPSVVPVGNQDSVGYLLLYVVTPKKGPRIAVRETYNYIDRKMEPSHYIQHVIIGRCPLPDSDRWAEEMAYLVRNIQFAQPAKASARGDEQDDESEGDDQGEEDDAAARRPSTRPSPAQAQ